MNAHLPRRHLIVAAVAFASAFGLSMSYVLFPALLRAQDPVFEVASIRPSADQGSQGADIGVRISGSQVRISYQSLRDYVTMAYQVPLNRIDAPEWVARTRFDIAAKLPDGAGPAQFPRLLQQLLIDRFDLKAHRSSKVLQVYALTVLKSGLKLKGAAPVETSPDPNAFTATLKGGAAGVFVDFGDGSSFTLANDRLELVKATMAGVAETLTRLMDRPVIDATGLTGRYDIALSLARDDYTAVLSRAAVNTGVVVGERVLRTLDAATPDPFSRPLQQYGVTLEPRRAPVEIVVIDSMSRTPKDN